MTSFAAFIMGELAEARGLSKASLTFTSMLTSVYEVVTTFAARHYPFLLFKK